MITVKLDSTEKQLLLEALREWTTTKKFQDRRVETMIDSNVDLLEALSMIEQKICMEPDDTVYHMELKQDDRTGA